MEKLPPTRNVLAQLRCGWEFFYLYTALAVTRRSYALAGVHSVVVKKYHAMCLHNCDGMGVFLFIYGASRHPSKLCFGGWAQRKQWVCWALAQYARGWFFADIYGASRYPTKLCFGGCAQRSCEKISRNALAQLRWGWEFFYLYRIKEKKWRYSKWQVQFKSE